MPEEKFNPHSSSGEQFVSKDSGDRGELFDCTERR